MVSATERSDHEEPTRVDEHASAPSAELAPTVLGTTRQGTLADWLQDQLTRGLGARLGRYALLRVIGRGGMGVVFAAYDEELDRRVAIKLLRAPSNGPPLDREVLRNEARAMARLSHPNIVQVYDVGEVEGQLFVAMEFVAGASLREWLRRSPHGWREIVDMFVLAGRGLQAAHEAGIVHCDFKPANVLVGDDGRPRVLDFGLAQRRGDASVARNDRDSQQTPRVGGTPSYMAPELYAGALPDVRSDHFAFCVALYEGLYGRRPFQGENLDQLRIAVLAGHLVPPPLDDRTPPWLRRAVLRGLAVDPAARWPSMQALLAELGRDRVRARHRQLLAGGAVALAGLIGLGAWQGSAAVKAAERARCGRSEHELALALGPEARAAAWQAIRATEVPHAERTLITADAALDDFISRSNAVHAAACDRAVLQGTLTADMMELHERCQAAQRDEVLATLDVLRGADATMVDLLHRTLDYLPNPERCDDLRHLADLGDDARRSAAYPRRAAILAELPKIRAAARVGRYAEVERLLAPLVAEVALTDDRALRADIFLEAARNAADRGSYDDAERLRFTALTDALTTGDAETAAWIALDTIGDELFRQARPAEARRWIAVAEGLIPRTGTDDLTFELTHYRSGLASVVRDHEAALALYDQALAIAERQGRSLRSRAGLLNNRGIALLYLSRFDEALTAHREALRDLTLAVGDAHPDVPITLGNIGLVQLHAGDLDAALATYREAAEGTERLLGAHHPGVAIALQNLAAVEIELGALDDALAHATRARAILDAAGDPSLDLLRGYVDTALGDIVRRRGDLDQGEARCAAALGALEAGLGADHIHLMYPLLCLGEIALARGRDGDARDRLERALRLAAESLEITRADRGHVRQALARALAAGGEIDRARELADQAIAAYAEAGHAYADRRRALEEWRLHLAEPARRPGAPG